MRDVNVDRGEVIEVHDVSLSLQCRIDALILTDEEIQKFQDRLDRISGAVGVLEDQSLPTSSQLQEPENTGNTLLTGFSPIRKLFSILFQFRQTRDSFPTEGTPSEDFNRQEMLRTLLKSIRLSSSTRIPHFQLFHIVFHHLLPRKRAIIADSIKDVPMDIVYSPKPPGTLPSRVRNNLTRKHYTKSGVNVKLLGVGEMIWHLAVLELNRTHPAAKSFKRFVNALVLAFVNIGYFMYRLPKRAAQAHKALKDIEKVAQKLLKVSQHEVVKMTEKMIIDVTNDTMCNLRENSSRWEVSSKTLSNLMMQLDKEEADNRPQFEGTIDQDRIQSELKALGAHVVKVDNLPSLDRLNMVGSGSFATTHQLEVPSDRSPFLCGKTESVRVAVKKIKSSNGTPDETLLKRILREAYIWAVTQRQLKANELIYIVPLIAVWLNNSHCYPLFVSHYCNDGTFREYVRSDDRPAEDKRMKLILDVANGIKCLHRLKRPGPIVHGDIKSDNILIDEGVAKLTDFGLAALKDGVRGLTTLNHGSECYVAPEIWKAIERSKTNPEETVPLTTACDMFSFGCILLEGITCDYPFKDADLKTLRGKPVSEWRGLIEGATQIKDTYWQLLEQCWDDLPHCRIDADSAVESMESICKKLRRKKEAQRLR